MRVGGGSCGKGYGRRERGANRNRPRESPGRSWSLPAGGKFKSGGLPSGKAGRWGLVWQMRRVLVECRDVKTMDFEPLPLEFYEGSARTVAPLLVGHWLVRRLPEGMAGGMIVETEAYLVGDPASHAWRGRTERNASMWGPCGRAYVYLIYGFHHCLNAVCGPEGTAEAALIRAVEPRWGLDWMAARRRKAKPSELASGPGKLCQALGINRGHDGIGLCAADSEIAIARNPDRETLVAAAGGVETTPRIGLAKAADWPLRFLLRGNPHVSKTPAGQRRSGG